MMKTISTPSRKTPLKLTTNANQSSPNRLVRAASRAACVCSAYSAASSWSALRPEERKIALRNHCRPKISNRVPTASCSAASGSQVTRAYPATAVNAASATTARAVPAQADRQLRVTPIANTMVRASTNSTNDAANTVTASPTTALLNMLIPLERPSLAAGCCQQGALDGRPERRRDQVDAGGQRHVGGHQHRGERQRAGKPAQPATGVPGDRRQQDKDQPEHRRPGIGQEVGAQVHAQQRLAQQPVRRTVHCGRGEQPVHDHEE